MHENATSIRGVKLQVQRRRRTYVGTGQNVASRIRCAKPGLDAKIADSEDSETGLSVFSLYGETRKPTPAMLVGMDTLVFDIQDIGTRFYTYISTLGLAMEAAAEHRLLFVVLDRPNPINGRDVAGPVADAGRESFTAYHRLPIRHGMTVGELARMFQAERVPGLDLEVVALENWRRDEFFDATGLRWVNPSPNMRSLAQALLYPGIGLREAAGLSFRGLGPPETGPEWGVMLTKGVEYLEYSEQWLLLPPGLAISLTVLGFNLLGDGLRDAFDPRQSSS